MLFNVDGITEWIFDGRVFDIGLFEFCIPANSFFSVMQNTQIPSQKDENGRFIIKDESAEDFVILCMFLNGNIHVVLQDGRYNNIIDIITHLLDKYSCDTNNLDRATSRWFHLTHENWIRDNMYQPDFEYHPMNTDKYYALYNTDLHHEKDLKDLQYDEKYANDNDNINVITDNILFSSIENVHVQPRESIRDYLTKIDFLADIPGVFVAGGYIFSALYGTEAPDIDVFLYRTKDDDYKTDDEAMEKINQIVELITNNINNMVDVNANNMPSTYSFTRTKYALTLYGPTIPIQIIFRIYNSPSEVLHGFDVDSCCLGYKQGKIWYTGRAANALRAGFNTIDFDRMSPSYEYRLVKYAIRGMSIYVPDMNRRRIDQIVLSTYVEKGAWRNRTNLESRYKNAHRNLKGLNLLLFLEAYYDSTNKKKKLNESFVKLAYENSDYSPVPFHLTNPNNGCVPLWMYIHYLTDDDNAQKYPDHYPEYMIHFENFRYENSENLDSEEHIQDFMISHQDIQNIFINNFLSPSAHGRIIFLKADELQKLPNIMNINEHIYEALAIPGKWEFPRSVQFKRIRPGEQATSSFHKIVLDNPKSWYDGLFYQ